MNKILFVCHGNICRSPMAEYVMKDIVNKAGLDTEFLIDSAATSSEELGNHIYPPVKRLLEDKGINCSDKTARKLIKSDYDKYDLLIGMDKYNLYNMQRICGEDIDNKMFLLMDFTDRPKEVNDPWYTRDFNTTYSDVNNGCKALFDYLMNK